jgi:CDGSH-type Zn-finger protein
MPVTITVRKNGPFRVEATDGAEIKLVDADGKAFDLQGKAAFSLCRCGHSANKPFCDGSHKTVGFQADDVAPRVEGS